MKIVYIGAGDELAETLVERMGQEGNEVYLLSDRPLPYKTKGICPHRFYRRPRRGKTFQNLLESIAPDFVIFAGNHYMNSGCDEKADEDVNLLNQSLRTVTTFPNVRFILLSSIEVYGNTAVKADESAECVSVSERGIRFIREEQLLEIYRKQYGMDTVILRASQLYANQSGDGKGDFLSRILSDEIQKDGRMQDDVFQPLHFSDFVDAVMRVMNGGNHHVYNVCADTEVSAKRLYQLAERQGMRPEQTILWERPESVTLADSGRIRQELGWTNFRNLEEQLQKCEITYVRVPEKRQRRKKWNIPADIRQLGENLFLFGVFFVLCSLCGAHSLFSQIDWMMIYVILISTSYNIYQSALGAVLAGAAYIYSHDLNILQMTTFYSYADMVLIFLQYVFLGLIVSYTASVLRQRTQSISLDLEMLKEEYEDLKTINEENVLIKNEYEERLLTSKNGFPKLYDLISRLMVQEPDRILMETLEVVSELVRTDTVAIYQGQTGSPWLRLVGALGNGSAMEGKSWNLSKSPRIYDAVMRGELYQGEFGSGEPSIVMPIVCRDVPQAVILIKTLPYECETLYHINLLKTMSLLLRDSMEKALQYEELSRFDHYVSDTDILKPEPFRKRVRLAREKAEKCEAEYCVVELVYSGSLEGAASVTSRVLRVTDYLGTDEEGKLYALLNNTDSENLAHLQKRLLDCGIEIRLDTKEMAEA